MTPEASGTYVTSLEMWLLLLSTVRYAMGRSSYIVSDACGMVRRYAPQCLTRGQIAQVGREVREAVRLATEAGGTLGHAMDQAEWEALTAWCEEHSRE